MTSAGALDDLGYSRHWRECFAPYAVRGLEPARVVRSSRGSAVVAGSFGVLRAKPAAALIKAAGLAGLPVVGDWVALLMTHGVEVPLVEAVLPRRSAIVRRDPGDATLDQALAANVDVVFIVHPIATAPNLRRLERELALAWDSGAVPVVVLTKADLSPAPQEALAAVAAVAPGAEVILTSAVAGEGLAPLVQAVAERRSAVLLGPSGAGKSTLVNALLGEERQATREVRVGDGRGRHTTVDRQLITLPGGGMIIDTPGLRALALTGSEEGIAAAFPDIAAAAAHCRFRDCAHGGEPGCAVAAAVQAGTLPEERLMSYQKLVQEARRAALDTEARRRLEERQKWKGVSKAARQYNKHYRQTGRG